MAAAGAKPPANESNVRATDFVPALALLLLVSETSLATTNLVDQPSCHQRCHQGLPANHKTRECTRRHDSRCSTRAHARPRLQPQCSVHPRPQSSPAQPRHTHAACRATAQALACGQVAARRGRNHPQSVCSTRHSPQWASPSASKPGPARLMLRGRPVGACLCPRHGETSTATEPQEQLRPPVRLASMQTVRRRAAVASCGAPISGRMTVARPACWWGALLTR